MQTIVVANQKGGIAKTTTAMALAALLQRDGKRTLLIDTDPQGNATDTYQARIEGEATLYDVLIDEDRTAADDAIQHTPLGDIIASDPLLRKADEVMSFDIEGMYRLADALEPLKDLYDMIIIDTASALNMLLYNALIAADRVVIPVLADRYSIIGLAQLSDTVCAVKRRQNPKVEIAGLLLVKYGGRTNLSKAARQALENDAAHLGTVLFSTAIRECVKCQEAQAEKQSLLDYAPTCTTAQDYESFYRELFPWKHSGDMSRTF